jgi:hypothetical protein
MLAMLAVGSDMDGCVDVVVRSERSYGSAYSIYFDNYVFYLAR